VSCLVIFHEIHRDPVLDLMDRAHPPGTRRLAISRRPVSTSGSAAKGRASFLDHDCPVQGRHVKHGGVRPLQRRARRDREVIQRPLRRRLSRTASAYDDNH